LFTGQDHVITPIVHRLLVSLITIYF